MAGGIARSLPQCRVKLPILSELFVVPTRRRWSRGNGCLRLDPAPGEVGQWLAGYGGARQQGHAKAARFGYIQRGDGSAKHVGLQLGPKRGFGAAANGPEFADLATRFAEDFEVQPHFQRHALEQGAQDFAAGCGQPQAEDCARCCKSK